MNIESPNYETEPVRKAATEAYNTVREDTCEALSCASEQIRKNPVAVVMGAIAFGVAIGWIIRSGQHQATFQERYVNEPLDSASDAISTSLGRLYGNLKFW